MTEHKKSKSKSKSTDALALLKEDHRAVQKIFKEFAKAKSHDGSNKAELVKTACQELIVHTQIEEEIFYPALREAMTEHDMLDEAKVEHQLAKELVEELEDMNPDDPLYDAKFTVLGEYVNHHIKEEEGEMFPAAKKADVDLVQLGERMLELREELAQAEAA